jgi:DNA-directed RNA polymerase subunit beta'
MRFENKTPVHTEFDEVSISISSPEDMLNRSSGEIVEPETRNHRTYNAVPGGLFCPRIFGPEEDWKCFCGKYKGIKYKLTRCDQCGVEINQRRIRRQRMGHIKLLTPVVHIWYFKSPGNKIGHLLGLNNTEVESIIYYTNHVVIQAGFKSKEGFAPMQLITQREMQAIKRTIPAENRKKPDSDPTKFITKIGADAIKTLLQQLDLDELSATLRDKILNETSQQRITEAINRLKVVEAFRSAQKRGKNKPEWMVMQIIPVISPEYRPLFFLDTGKLVSSDITTLLQKLLNRNRSLARLEEVKAPPIIKRHAMRLVQEAADDLLDNSRRGNATASDNGRPLKSHSDGLGKKRGYFRQNLLGKRVDYSGRSVIIGNPTLKLHECGLPKIMAAELFKPFIIRQLMEQGYASTVKDAHKIIEQKEPVIYDILKNQIKSHPVLLNRPPTLHRLSVQAFIPRLVEGKALQLHPLVCKAFNADFDGDQMAVHVPLSQEAITEALELMLPIRNILNPSNGEPIVVPTQDMVLGLYYLTKGKKNTPKDKVKGEGMVFGSIEEVIIAINSQKLSKHAHIKLRTDVRNAEGVLQRQIIDTVAGRAIVNQHMPSALGFFNELLSSKKLEQLVLQVHEECGPEQTANFLDMIKEIGFKYCYEGGLTFGLDDIQIPKNKKNIIKDAEDQVAEVKNNYAMGVITGNERYNQTLDVWTAASKKIADTLLDWLEEDQQGFNSVYMMLDSGARGSREQVRQLGGMRGLMSKPQRSGQKSLGSVHETPIVENFKEGLDIGSYFVSTHGARKGLTDTAIKTADAGYLSRILSYTGQSVFISEADCGTLRGRTVERSKNYEDDPRDFLFDLIGRVALEDIIDPATGVAIVEGNQIISKKQAIAIDATSLTKVDIRSLFTCEQKIGVCQKCYGIDLTTGKEVEVGEAVGIVAAQSISEPGTQLTLNTFHFGGTANKIVVASSLTSNSDGIVHFENVITTSVTSDDGIKSNIVVIGKAGEVQILDPKTKQEKASYHIPYGATMHYKHRSKIQKGDTICHWDPYNSVILSTISGTVAFDALEKGVTYKEEFDEQTGNKEKIVVASRNRKQYPNIIITGENEEKASYSIPKDAYLVVDEDDTVHAGQVIAKIPRSVSQTGDITGGLPRVRELFEARMPSNAAIVSAIEGVVTYGSIKRNNREVLITTKDKNSKKYLIPLAKHILVQDGDYVKAGASLSEGVVSLADILKTRGPAAAQEYLLREVQAVYKLQGIRIDNKHPEIIIRQMMRKVQIVVTGDTLFIPKQLVDRDVFYEANEAIRGKKIVLQAGDSNFKIGDFVSPMQVEDEEKRLKSKNMTNMPQVRDAKPAIGESKVQGVTRSSVESTSFLASASFQETSKVLTNAAIAGKKDKLRGITENVIVGNLIPVGTGFKKYKKVRVMSKTDYEILNENIPNQSTPVI